jgi:hypothetical protein
VTPRACLPTIRATTSQVVLVGLRAAVLTIAALAVVACGGNEPDGAPSSAREAVPPRFQSVGGIQARDTKYPGLVADLLTASREEGRLTVAVRFRNAGTDTVRFALPSDGGSYPSVRLEAGGRAWPIARGEDGEPQAPGTFERSLVPGQGMLWRAVFEAPPAGITAFDLAMPGLSAPFQAIPITDRVEEPTGPEEIEEGELPQE